MWAESKAVWIQLCTCRAAFYIVNIFGKLQFYCPFSYYVGLVAIASRLCNCVYYITVVFRSISIYAMVCVAQG